MHSFKKYLLCLTFLVLGAIVNNYTLFLCCNFINTVQYILSCFL